MAKDRSKPKKKRWYSYMADAYRISKKTYPWIAWALLGAFAVGVLFGVIFGAITKAWVPWIILGVVVGLMLVMVALGRFVRKASYAQIDGMPGAASAVLRSIRKGWSIIEEPVRFNARTQDMLFRAVGRPGVLLIADGDLGRCKRLVEEEKRAIKRVAPTAPVEVIYTGNGEGQTPLIKVERTMAKMKKKISNQEVAALARRLDALNTNQLPIPKGIDPMRARPDRKAMRGR